MRRARYVVLVLGALMATWHLKLGIDAYMGYQAALAALEGVQADVGSLRMSIYDRGVSSAVNGLAGAVVLLSWTWIAWRAITSRLTMEDKMAEQRVLAALGKMSALLAHELRNPLAAAMGQAELLEMLLPEGRNKAKAGEINKELERLEALSSNLLAFVNSRRVDALPSQVDGMVKDVVRLANNPALEVDTSGAPELWVFDPITLVRAVDNVVSNALSFTPAGGTVSMTVTRDEDRLVITVRDQGPGFGEGLDVFEPFVTSRVQGTGLGLSISSEIVRAHGGNISASNHPDGGAIVRLSLPGQCDDGMGGGGSDSETE